MLPPLDLSVLDRIVKLAERILHDAYEIALVSMAIDRYRNRARIPAPADQRSVTIQVPAARAAAVMGKATVTCELTLVGR